MAAIIPRRDRMFRTMPAWVALAILLLVAHGPAWAQRREEASVNVAGSVVSVHLHVPPGSGPFPVLILSHGSPRDAAGRSEFGRGTLGDVAANLARRGILIGVPIRRGYGPQPSSWAEHYGGCAQARYREAGLASAEDIRAAAAMVAARPDADPKRIVLMGVSAGGWGSIAAASKPLKGLVGVVNFAGGRGSRGPDDVCKPDELVAAAASYGRGSRVPELWIYSVNDRFFGPELAQRLHRAFTAAGGQARFVAAPAYGEDGHRYIRAMESWAREVDAFFLQVGFTGAKR